ncbi:MAG: hypothetical protein ACLQVD_13410 [Capsulimonadaceae bacterium]
MISAIFYGVDVFCAGTPAERCFPAIASRALGWSPVIGPGGPPRQMEAHARSIPAGIFDIAVIACIHPDSLSSPENLNRADASIERAGRNPGDHTVGGSSAPQRTRTQGVIRPALSTPAQTVAAGITPNPGGPRPEVDTFEADFGLFLDAVSQVLPPQQIILVTSPRLPGMHMRGSRGYSPADHSLRVERMALVRGLTFLDACRDSTIRPPGVDAAWLGAGGLSDRGHQEMAAFLVEGVYRQGRGNRK